MMKHENGETKDFHRTTMEHEPDPIEHVGTFRTYEEVVMALTEEEREEVGRGLAERDHSQQEQEDYLREWVHEHFITRTWIDVYRVNDIS